MIGPTVDWSNSPINQSANGTKPLLFDNLQQVTHFDAQSKNILFYSKTMTKNTDDPITLLMQLEQNFQDSLVPLKQAINAKEQENKYLDALAECQVLIFQVWATFCQNQEHLLRLDEKRAKLKTNSFVLLNTNSFKELDSLAHQLRPLTDILDHNYQKLATLGQRRAQVLGGTIDSLGSGYLRVMDEYKALRERYVEMRKVCAENGLIT